MGEGGRWVLLMDGALLVMRGGGEGGLTEGPWGEVLLMERCVNE